MSEQNKITVGGQAVIEGVMMRSYTGYAIAVWIDEAKLLVKKVKHIPLTRKKKFLDIPVLRGLISFFEMMVIGIKTLNFSAEVAISVEEKKEYKEKEKSKKDSLMIFFTMIFALGLGLLLFFALPLWITTQFIPKEKLVLFNSIAGVIRLMFFIIYVYAISFMNDVKRLFQFHGAEHKTVFAYENNDDLTYDNIKKFSTFHPRCGTSFLVLVVLISILVFSIGDAIAFSLGMPNKFIFRFLNHMIFLPFVAGFSYELLRFSGKKPEHFLSKIFSFFGLMLQRITTQEPDEKQIFAASCALEHALKIDENQTEKEVLEECTISSM